MKTKFYLTLLITIALGYACKKSTVQPPQQGTANHPYSYTLDGTVQVLDSLQDSCGIYTISSSFQNRYNVTPTHYLYIRTTAPVTAPGTYNVLSVGCKLYPLANNTVGSGSTITVTDYNATYLGANKFTANINFTSNTTGSTVHTLTGAFRALRNL